jgi:uncharacterized protein YecE (DUF72 family)
MNQIYTESLYQNRITSRSHKVGGKSYQEHVLPVESVREYFQHFPVLEVDYTFYQVLRDQRGQPTQSYRTLKAYHGQTTEKDSLIVKVPQLICARKIRQGNHYEKNPSYLDAEVFHQQFYEPAVELLGTRLRAFIFEQEYQRRDERMPLQELAGSLEDFLGRIPADDRYHVELRTESYLETMTFQVLGKFGVGQVLSHWTWLPSLASQFAKAGGSFFNAGRQAIVRLMTPRGTRYEEAYARAFPFHDLVPGMMQPEMIEDTVRMMREALRQKVQLNVIINNRAGGNAPRIAQLVAARFLQTD